MENDRIDCESQQDEENKMEDACSDLEEKEDNDSESEKQRKNDTIIDILFQDEMFHIPVEGILNYVKSIQKNPQDPQICDHFMFGKCKYEDNCFKVHLTENTQCKDIERIRDLISKNNDKDESGNRSSFREFDNHTSRTQFGLIKNKRNTSFFTERRDNQNHNQNNKSFYHLNSSSNYHTNNKFNYNQNNSDDDDDNGCWNPKKRKWNSSCFQKNDYRGNNNNNNRSTLQKMNENKNNHYQKENDSEIGNKKIKVDVDNSGNGVVLLPLQSMESTKQSRTLCKFPDSAMIGKVCSYFGEGHCKNGSECSFLHIKPWFLNFVKENMGSGNE